MRVVVLGAGVIGVTSAFYLAQEGHEVTVIAQMSKVGQDATGGNAGLIAPGHSFAWASPQAPKMLMRSLRGEATAIRVKMRADPRLVWWGMQFLRECNSERARINTLAKLALCQYSQAATNELATSEGIDYQQVTKGLLYLYREEADLQVGLAKMELLREHGQQLDVLDKEGLARLDPAFADSRVTLAGAIHGVTDSSGNSELFTTILADRCKALGVEFRLGESVKSLKAQHGHVLSVETDLGEIRGDQYVLALGIRSPFISRTVGQSLPIYPAKGYSLTVPVKNPDRSPQTGGVDEKTLVAWSPLGANLRMSSTAEFAGYDRTFRHSDFSNILSTAQELFPDAADWETAQMRSCLRPMTPDGPPIIGRGAKHDNLWYNTGHGHIGWTMACGSSLALADVMAGRQAAVDMEPFKVRSVRR